MSRNLPEGCFHFVNAEGTEGFMFAELGESGAFQYGNKTYCDIRIAVKHGEHIGASRSGLDTRYVPVLTDDGFEKVMKTYLEDKYGELVVFEKTGISHW